MIRTLTRVQKLQLIAHSLADYRTIANAYAGRPMKAPTHDRIVRSARELKLPAPLPLNHSR